MFSIGRFEVDSRREQLLVGTAAPLLVHGGAAVLSRLDQISPRQAARVQTTWARSVRLALDMRIERVGLDNLPAEPSILLPLHEGFADVPVLMHLGRSLRFIAREELFDWPQLGRVLKGGGHVLLRDDPSIRDLRSVVDHSRAILDAGHDLVVFPQGSILGIEVAFARGARRLAAMTGAPVVPVVITGTHRVWEHPYSGRLRRGVQTRLELLEPVAASDVRAAWRDIERTMKRRALRQERAPARRFIPERDGWWDGYAYEIDPAFPDLARRVAGHRAAQLVASA